MNQKENPSYYAIIPADIRYSQDLPPNTKLLYGEITALCNKEGYCWAMNSYFAHLYNVNKATVSRWIAKLEQAKKIKTKIFYKEDGKTIEKRLIFLTETSIVLTKKSIGIDEKINTPMDEKVIDNTTSNNTTNNKKVFSKQQKKKDIIPASEVEAKFRPAYEKYPGEKGEYWQTYHCFLKGCKASGLDPAKELDLLLTAIEKQISYRQKKTEGFVPEWRNMEGWLSTARWHWEAPKEIDSWSKYDPTDEEIDRVEAKIRETDPDFRITRLTIVN